MFGMINPALNDHFENLIANSGEKLIILSQYIIFDLKKVEKEIRKIFGN